MLLRRLVVEDFGLFAGKAELDLMPRRGAINRPIVLIGGKNGAGKTTLLEAVRLALYGRRALGARVGQGEYDEYLRSRIYRGNGSTAAAVELAFDYAEAGFVHHYCVRRKWLARGKSITETLTLEKNAGLLPTVPREEWHQFLQELIPPGVSQLFFFDGEKIREIADTDDDEQLAQAVRGLLGIELVSSLRTDIGLYLARHQRAEANCVVARLEALLRDLGVAERRAAELADGIAELRATRDSQARAAEQTRRQFVSEGGDAAIQRAKLEADREEVRRGLDRAEQHLRELCNHLLPFAMAPKVIGGFRTVLESSGGAVQTSSFQALLCAVQTWQATGEPKREGRWSSKHWNDLAEFLNSRAETAQADIPALREVGDGSAAMARFVDVELIVRPRALALLHDFEGLHRRADELDQALARADSAAAGLLLDELRLAEQRVGATEVTLRAREEELKLIRGQIVTLRRDQARLLEQQAEAAASAERSALAARTAQALANYEHRLFDHKLRQLRDEFVLRFNRLARKAGLISDIRIDANSFATTLIDAGGNDLPKAALSAGEKQVFAIAMLWALARTSGRPLPMIIDTPLARLDSDHRGRLVERYFPAASHQVVLLSTDTEVDSQLALELGPSISHSYRLDYDPVQMRTSVSPGYFYDASNGERRYAL